MGFANPGDYHVSIVASMDGFEDSRQSVIVHTKSLPAWATGSFSGYVAGNGHEYSLNGYFTMSVTAKGEISGKLDRDDENFSFTASSYAASDDRSFSVTNVVLKQSVLRRVYDNKKKKWGMAKVLEDTDYRLDIKVEQGIAGVLTAYMYSVGEPDDGDSIVAQQNRWGTTYKSLGAALFTASAKQKYKTFTITGGYDEFPDGASLTFKITPSGIEAAVSFSGTFKQKEHETFGDNDPVIYYEATSTILWKGWRIPFTLTLEKDMFGNENWEVGRLTFNTYSPDQSAPEAVFTSAENVADNAIGGQAALQEFWRWRRYESDGMHHLGEIFPDVILHDEPAVLEPGDMVEWGEDDWLVYRFRSNGSVSIDGVIGGQAVKTSSVVLFIDSADSGYSGCFFVNLGESGLFVQKCHIEIAQIATPEFDGASVTTDGSLKYVWSPSEE